MGFHTAGSWRPNALAVSSTSEPIVILSTEDTLHVGQLCVGTLPHPGFETRHLLVLCHVSHVT